MPLGGCRSSYGSNATVDRPPEYFCRIMSDIAELRFLARHGSVSVTAYSQSIAV